MILFRAACSMENGTGHLRRCLTLAEELRVRGKDVEIITDDNEVAHRIASSSSVLVRYVVDRTFLEISTQYPAVLVIDIPAGSKNQLLHRDVLSEIADLDQAGVAVVVLGHVRHDVHHFRAVIDLYPTLEISAVNYLEGPDYLILRPEFSREDAREECQKDSILVAMGGSDPFDLTWLALEALSLAGCKHTINIVLGAAYGLTDDELVARATAIGLKVSCHRELAAGPLVELMQKSTAGIVAFGTTAYELMALGIPVMALTHYRWQETSAKLFFELGALRYLGCAEKRPTAKKLASGISSTLSDRTALEDLGRRGLAVVDGKGTARVADLLMSVAEEVGARQLDCLYVLSHPGDEIFGCCGNILKQIREGLRVGVVILGEGVSSRYSAQDDRRSVHEAQRQIRKALQTSMDRLGIQTWYYCRFDDNRFDHYDRLDLVQAIEAIVKRHRPHTVFTHHAADLNIDHRLTYEATVTAIRPISTSVKTLYSIEVPSSSDWGCALSQQGFKPNWFEDISVFMEEKLELAAIYSSEIRDAPHPRSLEGLQARAVYWGQMVGVLSAEAFVLQQHVSKG